MYRCRVRHLQQSAKSLDLPTGTRDLKIFTRTKPYFVHVVEPRFLLGFQLTNWWYMQFILTSLLPSLQLKVFRSQTLRTVVHDYYEVKSFKFSTTMYSCSPQASWCEILLAQPHFYQPRVSKLVEMSNPVVVCLVSLQYCWCPVLRFDQLTVLAPLSLQCIITVVIRLHVTFFWNAIQVFWGYISLLAP